MCNTKEDCIDYNNDYSNIKLDDVECIKDSGKFKYFKDQGYCTLTNKFKDNKCTTIDMMGQQNENGKYKAVNCKLHLNEYPNVQGVAGRYNLCDTYSVPDTNNACAQYGICDNNWQAKSSDVEPNCQNSLPEEINLETLCCPSEYIAKDFQTMNPICCSERTTTIPDSQGSDVERCVQTTKYNYSKSHLLNNTNEPMTDNLVDSIPCTTNSDCELYNNDLAKNLDITVKELNNASLYCDNEKGYCKAYCGDLNNRNTKFSVVNDDTHKISMCYNSTVPNTCNIGKTTWESPSSSIAPVNNIPICENPHNSGDGPRWAGTNSEKFNQYEVMELLIFHHHAQIRVI